VSKLELNVSPGRESGAADQSVASSETFGEVGHAICAQVTGDELDAHGMEFGDVSLFVGPDGSQGSRRPVARPRREARPSGSSSKSRTNSLQ
jgi:hypothetical protein